MGNVAPCKAYGPPMNNFEELHSRRQLELDELTNIFDIFSNEKKSRIQATTTLDLNSVVVGIGWKRRRPI